VVFRRSQGGLHPGSRAGHRAGLGVGGDGLGRAQGETRQTADSRPTEAKTEAKADRPDPDHNEFIITKRKDGTFRVTPRSLSRMVRLGPGPDRARAGAPKDEAAEPLGGPFVGKRPPIKEIVAGADLTGATLHPFFDPGDPLGTLKLYDLPDPQYRPRQILSGANGELFLLEPGKVESQSGAHRCSHLRPAERGPPPKPRPGLR